MDEIGTQKKEIQSKQAERKKKQSYDRDQLLKYKVELDSYNKELKEYSVDLNKWKSVQTETESRRQELTIKIENLKKEIMCNRAIKFEEWGLKIDSKELFGEIIVEDTSVKVNSSCYLLFDYSLFQLFLNLSR